MIFMKKMLKRSLALSALMAFVITGNAMAADNDMNLSADQTLDSAVDGTQININLNGHTLTIDSETQGIHGKYIISGDGGNLDIQANKGAGIWIGGTIDGIDNLKIASSSNSIGVYTDTTITANNIDINCAANSAIYVEDSEADLTINVKDSLTVVSKGHGINNGPAGENNKIIINGGDHADISIIAYENAVDARGGQDEIQITGKSVNIQSLAQDEGETDNKKGHAVYARSEDSSIIIKAAESIVINAEEGKKAVQSTAGSIVISSSGETAADVIINGDIASDGNSANVEIFAESEQSVITSTITADSNGVTDIHIANNAVWNNTGESNVTTLSLNDGVVKMAADNAKINVDKLAGSGGSVEFNNSSQLMTVNEKTGEPELKAIASQKYAEQLASDNMTASAQKLADQVILEENNKSIATDVYIPETAVTGVYTAKVEDGLVVSGQEAVNSTNKAVSEMANHNLMVWRLENNDMNKRLGELRDSKGEHGVWVRMTRGEGKYKSIKNQYNAYQLGYDEKLSADKSWTVGAAFTYTDGETSFATGSGENKHKGFAVYGSKLNKDGSFIDLIAKYSRLDNEFKAVAGIGNGEYETNGYSVSAEYGKRFTKANGFWIEPQVELTYGKVGSASYVTSRGVLAQQEGMESLVGRIGFAAGKNFKRGNAYVRASYLYDFDGDTKVTYSNASAARSIEDDLGGGWFEVGIGSNINLSEATHLYVDIEKTYGGDVAVPWQWNVGLRYSF